VQMKNGGTVICSFVLSAILTSCNVTMPAGVYSGVTAVLVAAERAGVVHFLGTEFRFAPGQALLSRTIRAGEPVVLDLGGTLAGYGSDTTRTIWVGGEAGIEPEPEFRRVYDLVREAQARATAEVRPGTQAQRIDAAARELIATAGYGEYFTHRVGHGIGLETHEDPYMVAGNATPLAPGMAFSVEPGIYLPGRWGVRLENIVMCSEAGGEVLNGSSLELRPVRG